MKKRLILTALALALLVAALAGVKALQIGAMIDKGKKFVPPPETVTTAAASTASWAREWTAIGTLTAVQGVTVAAELPGKVVRISFEPGSIVKKGDVLVGQDISSEEAELPGAEAQVRLARADLDRSARMLRDKIISQADHDRATAALDQAISRVASIRATMAKKTIRAPFGGHLGIRQANLGQILREGDPIVTLQSLDPIYVDFTLPQQRLAQLRIDLPVRVTCDALPGVTVEGRVTAINPLVESGTRNVQVQATVSNGKEDLRPGMFVQVAVGLPAREEVLTIPATAVLYAPYGDSVFVVEKDPQSGVEVLRQQFVRLGDRRGDFVAVSSGLAEGETVVSTGVFKLRNGQAVTVDNRLAPTFHQAPAPENS
ncbi:MAG: efflux RND transporter periplasmic adaptor subunit [Syntrophobacteraceae bacterium]|jgi:membrane fusion protein (multidrug efflux system)|nr:efflux RND transporter periplasmic adaptor subunit [Syntrophobacteraceae bacterium]